MKIIFKLFLLAFIMFEGKIVTLRTLIYHRELAQITNYSLPSTLDGRGILLCRSNTLARFDWQYTNNDVINVSRILHQIYYGHSNVLFISILAVKTQSSQEFSGVYPCRPRRSEDRFKAAFVPLYADGKCS